MWCWSYLEVIYTAESLLGRLALYYEEVMVVVDVVVMMLVR